MTYRYRGAGRLRGEGDCWGDGRSSSGGEASCGERLRPINRAGYKEGRLRREESGGGGMRVNVLDSMGMNICACFSEGELVEYYKFRLDHLEPE